MVVFENSPATLSSPPCLQTLRLSHVNGFASEAHVPCGRNKNQRNIHITHTQSKVNRSALQCEQISTFWVQINVCACASVNSENKSLESRKKEKNEIKSKN